MSTVTSVGLVVQVAAVAVRERALDPRHLVIRMYCSFWVPRPSFSTSTSVRPTCGTFSVWALEKLDDALARDVVLKQVAAPLRAFVQVALDPGEAARGRSKVCVGAEQRDTDAGILAAARPR